MASSDSDASIRDLAETLVRCHPEGVRLYQTSAAFHASIRTLAELLPLWVNGLADQARESQAVSEEQMRELLTRPSFLDVVNRPAKS